jgi:hypothetical protein
VFGQIRDGLKPFVVAMLIVSLFYTMWPYLVRHYSAYQNRMLVRALLENLEMRRRNELNPEALQPPAHWNEQPFEA